MSKLNSKIPAGELETKWTKYKSSVPLVNPANKRSIEVIVVGSGLAGASAAASLAELGYKVNVFVSRILLDAHIPLRLRAGSTRQKIIRMTETAFTGYFMIL